MVRTTYSTGVIPDQVSRWTVVKYFGLFLTCGVPTVPLTETVGLQLELQGAKKLLSATGSPAKYFPFKISELRLIYNL